MENTPMGYLRKMKKSNTLIKKSEIV